MPLITLDSVTALIVIDLQKGIADHPFLRPLTEVVAQTRILQLRFVRRACR